MNHRQLTRLFESGATDTAIDEILFLTTQIQPTFHTAALRQLHDDITRLFTGSYPGFQASNTRYHNLVHTCSVALATTRLLHGLACSAREISIPVMELAIYSAYFHDAGLLRTATDQARTGAIYTRNHEERSIAFMTQYLRGNNLPEFLSHHCPSVIRCTDLTLAPDHIAFPSPEARLAGYVLGSADILAQMADRYYLERLTFLFEEHRDGGLQTYHSAIELMQNTMSFYHNTIIKRLEKAFTKISDALQVHFRERWQINENLYYTNIAKNLDYLKTILDLCENRLECLETYLKRVPVP